MSKFNIFLIYLEPINNALACPANINTNCLVYNTFIDTSSKGKNSNYKVA